MNLEVRVSVLGTTFEGLSRNWNMETCYRPQINEVNRDRLLVRRNKAGAAVEAFHDEATS